MTDRCSSRTRTPLFSDLRLRGFYVVMYYCDRSINAPKGGLNALKVTSFLRECFQVSRGLFLPGHLLLGCAQRILREM